MLYLAKRPSTGSLTVTLVDPYTRNHGACFQILTFATHTGDFVFLNLPPNGVWNPDDGTVCF